MFPNDKTASVFRYPAPQTVRLSSPGCSGSPPKNDHIVTFFELAGNASLHRALGGPGINQFALGSFAFDRVGFGLLFHNQSG
jgi:hypothetical protein